MRTAKEIAEDIAKASEVVRGLEMINVYGKAPSELTGLHAELTAARERLFDLLAEQRRYVAASSSA
jgi:hypothetical protein